MPAHAKCGGVPANGSAGTLLRMCRHAPYSYTGGCQWGSSQAKGGDVRPLARAAAVHMRSDVCLSLGWSVAVCSPLPAISKAKAKNVTWVEASGLPRVLLNNVQELGGTAYFIHISTLSSISVPFQRLYLNGCSPQQPFTNEHERTFANKGCSRTPSSVAPSNANEHEQTGPSPAARPALANTLLSKHATSR